MTVSYIIVCMPAYCCSNIHTHLSLPLTHSDLIFSKMESIYKNSVPATQSKKLTQQVKSSSQGETFSEPIPNEPEPAAHKTFPGGSYDHMLIHRTLLGDSSPVVGSQQNANELLQGLSINSKSGTSEIDSPVNSNEPLGVSSPSHQSMPTATLNPQREDENKSSNYVPSLQTVAPTPVTPLSPSTTFPSACSTEDQLSTIVALQPQRKLSTTSQLSVESSLSSQGFVTAPSSPEIDYEFNPIQESDETRSQLQVQETSSCHQKRQQFARSSSREQYTELKRKFEEATKELSRLQIQCYVQQSAHSKKEEELLKELDLERNGRFELQVKLEKYDYLHLDLQVSLGQHQKYISALENKLILLNKKLEDVNSELKDVKVDAYDKGRELECLKLYIKKYEMELESLRKVPL